VGKAGVRHRRLKTEECCKVTTNRKINHYTHYIFAFVVLSQADILCARTAAYMINPHIGTGIHGFSFNSNYFQNDPRYALYALSFFKITSFRAPILSQKNSGSMKKNKKKYPKE
jgi:hypothetical protein